MDRFFTTLSSRIAGFVGQPLAFVIALATIILWAVTGPVFDFSDTWQLVINTSTTIITFLMVFLIQNSQNRDAAAIHAKLDELVRSIEDARNAFIGIEHMSAHQLEEIRAALEKECEEIDQELTHRETAPSTVARLLKRL
ncbi:low affinity iron permease family protein [Sphingosinicellaceae bacterium]|nr:low affinity iron permease family protein [Sphingosinicellaceae bacterium]